MCNVIGFASFANCCDDVAAFAGRWIKVLLVIVLIECLCINFIFILIFEQSFMLLSLLLFISFTNSFALEKITTIEELCSSNLFIRNIEPGETYRIVIKSDRNTSLRINNKWFQKSLAISKRKCRHDFKTSDSSAHFAVAIENMNIHSCDDNCRCNFFEIDVSGHSKRFCGTKEKDYFSSKSDKLSIEFHHRSSMQFDVSLTFTVERNLYIITGTPKDNLESTYFIETPYFPISYPPNYRAEYILQSNDKNSYILLLFLDFQISSRSFIEVVGNNGTHPTRFYGDLFRPPVIVSQSSQLSLKFQSNDQPGMPGFRVMSSFVKSVDSLVVPYTDCAESKDGRGGFISIKTHNRFGLYDCLWHIIPFTPFSNSNLSIYAEMRNIGHKSTLEFRRGSNSKSEIIKEINCRNQNCNYLDVETIVPASDFLYIRFNGYLDIYSVFNLSYSTYHVGNCSDKEFKCKNARCILSDLKCDGIPHCLDGSDEFCSSTVVLEEVKPSVQSTQRESLHSEDSYIYFVIFGCFGLISIVVTVSIFTYNRCKKSGASVPLQNHISEELTDVQPTVCPVNTYNSENPPSYEDFVKSSNCYPPILYTRSSQCFIPKSPCSQCTSFCTGARMRHHSADSFPPRNSNTSSGDIFLNINGDLESPNPNAFNVEIIQNNLSFKASKNTMKRSYSLDSKLNDLVNHDTCQLLLSIVHPNSHDMHHLPQVKCYTLPPNFKFSTFNNYNVPKVAEQSWLNLDSNVNLSKDRRFTWSFVPRRQSPSELITVVKTRGSSEPCRGISIYCSLY